MANKKGLNKGELGLIISPPYINRKTSVFNNQEQLIEEINKQGYTIIGFEMGFGKSGYKSIKDIQDKL